MLTPGSIYSLKGYPGSLLNWNNLKICELVKQSHWFILQGVECILFVNKGSQTQHSNLRLNKRPHSQNLSWFLTLYFKTHPKCSGCVFYVAMCIYKVLRPGHPDADDMHLKNGISYFSLISKRHFWPARISNDRQKFEISRLYDRQTSRRFAHHWFDLFIYCFR